MTPISEWIDPVWRLVTLADYNSRIVLMGTTMLGISAGVIGSFTLLRRRALIGDAISHAMLPGLGIAYLLGNWLTGDGKSLLWLFSGAITSGLLGVGVVLLIRHWARLSEDAAFGIVLSTFFGAGVALLGVIQGLESGHAAGRESFIYGKAASLQSSDLQAIAMMTLVCLLASGVLFKEWTLLCFDENFAISAGYSRLGLDGILMVLVTLIAVTGMQAVGLILVIALLIVPAAAARFWTDKMLAQILIAAAIGGLGCYLGAVGSALLPQLPTGPVIILITAALFAGSLILGSRRGLWWRWRRRVQWEHIMERQHVLRAIYERYEAESLTGRSQLSDQIRIQWDSLQAARSWSPVKLRRAVDRLQVEGLLSCVNQELALSRAGLAEAERLTHQHRLWELYLITHADVAVQHVDQMADDIEHVLEPAVVAELEQLLQEGQTPLLQSPHHALEGQS